MQFLLLLNRPLNRSVHHLHHLSHINHLALIFCISLLWWIWHQHNFHPFIGMPSLDPLTLLSQFQMLRVGLGCTPLCPTTFDSFVARLPPTSNHQNHVSIYLWPSFIFIGCFWICGCLFRCLQVLSHGYVNFFIWSCRMMQHVMMALWENITCPRRS